MIQNIRQINDNGINKKDVFFVDSNVLLLVHGGIANGQARVQLAAVYSAFIKKLLMAGCRLCVSVLNVQELLHVIERKHREIYNKTASPKVKPKQYRRVSSERKKLQRIQALLCTQLKETYELVPESVCEEDVIGFVDTYHSHCYEPIDYVLANHHAPMKLITDDKDFTLDDNVDVYTAQ